MRRHFLDYPLSASEIILSAGAEDSEHFMPLMVSHLKHGDKIPFDLYIKVKTKDSPEPQYFLCCPRDQVFHRRWYRKLRSLKVTNLYFAPADLEFVTDFLEEQLDRSVQSEKMSNLQKGIFTYEVIQSWTRNFFTCEKMQATSQVKRSLKFIDRFMHIIRQENTHLGFVFDIRRHDNTLYNHCLNVSMLGMAFVTFLGWPQEKVRDFGLGALLHDIGMTKTSSDLLQKNAPLTYEEREQIERHPSRGFALLKNFTCIWRDPLLMVLHHHENGDGSGYPQELKLPLIHPWARILRIVDSYEAMTAARPWRPPWSPQEALRIMRTDWEVSQIYDPMYLKAFIKFLSQI